MTRRKFLQLLASSLVANRAFGFGRRNVAHAEDFHPEDVYIVVPGILGSTLYVNEKPV